VLGFAIAWIPLPVPLALLLGTRIETAGHPHGGFNTEIITYHLPHQWLIAAVAVTCLSILLLCFALVRLAAIRKGLRTSAQVAAL